MRGLSGYVMFQLEHTVLVQLACTGLMKTEVMVVQSRRDMKGSDVIAHFAYLAEKQFSYLAVTV